MALLLALLLLAPAPAAAAGGGPCPHTALLTAVTGRCARLGPSRWSVSATGGAAITLAFSDGMALLLDYEGDDVFVLPDLDQGWQPPTSGGKHIAWLLPREPTSAQQAIMVEAESSDTALQLRRSPALPGGGGGGGVNITVEAGASCELRTFEARPRADVFGDRYELNFTGGGVLADTHAAFYWGTTLRLVVERTVAKGYTHPDGFVLSMLHRVPQRGVRADRR